MVLKSDVFKPTFRICDCKHSRVP